MENDANCEKRLTELSATGETRCLKNKIESSKPQATKSSSLYNLSQPSVEIFLKITRHIPALFKKPAGPSFEDEQETGQAENNAYLKNSEELENIPDLWNLDEAAPPPCPCSSACSCSSH